MESSSDTLTPENILNEADSVIENLLPLKSRVQYLKSYEKFIDWKDRNGAKSFSESVFLAYFSELSKKMKPSSLWSIYSMLKSTVSTRHNVHIKEYSKLTAFLKRSSDGFKSKKSKVFTAQNVETFLNKSPDDIYLATKVCLSKKTNIFILLYYFLFECTNIQTKYLSFQVALIFGVSGACRTSELLNITVDDIETHDNMLLIKLVNTKTKKDRMFVIRDEFVKVVDKYRLLRPTETSTPRFFLNYRNGKCTKQVIGRNKFGNFPKEIATFLKLPNPELYTGHCFRRTSATLLADSGANLTTLKRHGGWKSDQVAEGYIEESVENKSKITSCITEAINLNQSTSPRPSTSRDNDFIVTNQPGPSTSSDNIIQSQVKQTNINLPNKTLNLTFNNCSNITFNFNN